MKMKLALSSLLKSKSKSKSILRVLLPMAAAHTAPAPPIGSSESHAIKRDFPVPLTPPYPALSKEVELRRAMSASARSAAASQFGVLFEDEWISVLNKPPGLYCDAILSSLSSSVGES
jgi:23S rRNA-/tRNA-specific pseudouridylate synthase